MILLYHWRLLSKLYNEMTQLLVKIMINQLFNAILTDTLYVKIFILRNI